MNIYDGRIINNFLEPNKRQYTIPVYQRDYAWSKEQCVKLFEDIIRVSKSEKPHFCGAIVYAPLKSDGDISRYVVIDGQQRLTTVYILLKALVDMAQNEKQRNALEEDLVNHDKFEEFKIDSASKLKLKPVKTDNEQLLYLMANKKEKIDKEKSGIWKNYTIFCDLIKEQFDAGMTVLDIYHGVEKLRVARIELDLEDDAQETFERINSTGVPLLLADLIRNFVLMTDSNQEKLYDDYWHPAEEALTKTYLNPFFLDYLNFKADGFPREDEAYEAFKTIYKRENYTNESMLAEIYHYAMLYKAFMFGDEKYSKRVNKLLCDFRSLKQSTVFTFLFYVFDDFENHDIDEQELEKVLQFLLNYSIRRIVCEVGSNSLRGLYKSLHARVYTSKENKKHYYDALVSFLGQLTSKDAIPSDAMFKDALIHNNLYKKNALCKYLLTAIENQGKEQLNMDNLTIEHIMPQNRLMSSSWQNMLGENWQEVKDHYLHTLGNLTLTAYNSELGDKTFLEKKELLAEVHTKVVILYEYVKNQDIWNDAAILNRAEKLAEMIIELFPIIPPIVAISYNDPRFQEYTCDEPANATYKDVNYFVFRGEQINCSTFAEMLKQMYRRLYDYDRTTLEAMARNSEKLSTGSAYATFSFDPQKVKSDYQIEGTEIYASVGYSAYNIIWYIRALLDRFEIDRTDFIYSAKSNKPA